MAAGTLPEDLYYRLNVFPVELPPLRERARRTSAPLASHFLARHAALMHRRPPSVAEAAWRALEAHDWPGNVRELENFLQRALILSPGPELVLPDPSRRRSAARRPVDDPADEGPARFDDEVRDGHRARASPGRRPHLRPGRRRRPPRAAPHHAAGQDAEVRDLPADRGGTRRGASASLSRG